MKTTIENLKNELDGLKLPDILTYVLEHFGEKAALASSLGAEDQVLTDLLRNCRGQARIFTLDTGRLHPETYALLQRTNQKYGVDIEVFAPDDVTLAAFVREYGNDPFYESIEKRRMCCRVRKLEPLQRALATVDLWITGLRRQQSVTRSDMSMVEWDEDHGVIKLNPLIDWSEEEVWAYITSHHVPYNELHDQGYPSIGCEPCTRAVRQGEDIRAGRWWWETAEHRECGLHIRSAQTV